jgi:pimeloyl-ACP methyl ester carboxylesterase
VTFVLIPGAGGESWYWHRVVPLLPEAVAVDLPAADDDAGLHEYAQAVVGAVGDRRELTLVAQSMGAFVAPMLCDRLDVRAIALVAPMIPAPGETPGEWWSNTGTETPGDIVETFLHDLPPDILEEALARGEPRQSGRPFQDPWPLDAWPDVPTRVLAGRHDRLFPLEFMRALARERLGLVPDVIDSGHLPALSRPHELSDWLDHG